MEKARPSERRDGSGERHDDAPAGGEIGEKESGPLQARLSNLPYYAATGVKPQAFVPILFLCAWSSQQSK
jgi:hypothetical protein